MRSFIAFAAGVALAVFAPVTALAMHAGECTDERVEIGPLGDEFACGEIIVKPHDPDEIGEIITRQGGNPDTDILDFIEAIGWFVIAVEVGAEFEAVEAYRADPGVEEADFNAAAGGVADPTPTPAVTALPDAAVSAGDSGRAANAGMVAGILGALLVISSVAAIATRRP